MILQGTFLVIKTKNEESNAFKNILIKRSSHNDIYKYVDQLLLN